MKHRLVDTTKSITKAVGEQGYSLSRPGTVTTLINLKKGKITKLSAKGTVVAVLRGNILLQAIELSHSLAGKILIQQSD